MNRFLRMLPAMAAALLLSACTQDELADGNKTPLPEGKYPLEISGVTMSVESTSQPWGAKAPQTRVTENTDGMSSHWDGSETIHVKLGEQETTYKIKDANGSLELTGEQLYWTKRTDNVTAWYATSETNGTVDLANQSNGLAYVLRATVENASCDNPVTLNFDHALAKVRVLLKGSDAGKVNEVKIKSYTTCTQTQGTLDTKGATEDWITMNKPTGADYWEANVVPNHDITAFQVNRIEGTLKNGGIKPVAAKVNIITLTVKKTPLQPGQDGKFTISQGDDVLIKDYDGSAPIVVNGNATITLSNVKLNTNDNVMTINNGATVTLNVEGSNEFISTGGAGIKIMEMNNISPGGSITINGTSANSSSLKITAACGAAIGFRMYGYLESTNTIYGGDITIKNITLEAHGGSGSPAIGLSALESDWYDCKKNYGNISIDASTLTVTSKDGAACIGTPYHDTSSPFSLGTISITNSTVTATAEGNQAACIGFGYTGEGYNDKVIQKIEFTNTTLHLTTGAGNKVGCDAGNDDHCKLTDGIWNNGNKVGSTGWNP